MSYSRTSALDYAEKHWNTACHDNRISLIGANAIDVPGKKKEMGLSDEWVMKFIVTGGSDKAAFVNKMTGEQKVFQEWAGLGDCAHFMSNTLTAGGIQGLVTDYVPYLNGFLRGLPSVKVLASEAAGDRVKRIIDKRLMKAGDVILYVAPPGGELGGGYVHSAMFVSFNRITCHSISLWDADWTKPHFNGYTFTLIHFSHDDTVNTALDSRIAGWWQVTWRNETYFYFFDKGRVSYTQQKAAGNGPPGLPKQKGFYYTPTGTQLQICWPETGTLEELTLSADGSSLSGKWNEAEQITARR